MPHNPPPQPKEPKPVGVKSKGKIKRYDPLTGKKLKWTA